MRYNEIDIHGKIYLRGATPEVGQVMSFSAQNLPFWTAIVGGGGNQDVALVTKTAQQFITSFTQGEGFSEKGIIRVTGCTASISPIISDIVFVNYDEKMFYDGNQVYGRFINADWSGVGDYGDVQTLTGVAVGTKEGYWNESSASAGDYTLGDVVIYGSTATNFEHFQVTGTLNDSPNSTYDRPPSINSAFTKIPRRLDLNYGYVEEWNRIKFDSSGSSIFISYAEDSRGNSCSFTPNQGNWATTLPLGYSPSLYQNSISHFPWGNLKVTRNVVENSLLEIYGLGGDVILESNTLIGGSFILGNTRRPSHAEEIIIAGNYLLSSCIKSNEFEYLSQSNPLYISENRFSNTIMESCQIYGLIKMVRNEFYNSLLQNLAFVSTTVPIKFTGNFIKDSSIQSLPLNTQSNIGELEIKIEGNEILSTGFLNLNSSLGGGSEVSNNFIQYSGVRVYSDRCKVKDNFIFSTTFNAGDSAFQNTEDVQICGNHLFSTNVRINLPSTHFYSNRLDPGSSIITGSDLYSFNSNKMSPSSSHNITITTNYTDLKISETSYLSKAQLIGSFNGNEQLFTSDNSQFNRINGEYLYIYGDIDTNQVTYYKKILGPDRQVELTP